MHDEFEKRYLPLEKPLYLTAISYVRNAEDAKDMVQEAALCAYQAYARLRHKEYFKKLYGTIKNMFCGGRSWAVLAVILKKLQISVDNSFDL